MNNAIKFLIAALVMGVFDFLWLGFISKDFYASEIGGLLLENPNMWAAGVFYVIYVIGVIVFAVNPALSSGGLKSAVWRGALFGLVAYATYDLTNLATIEGFTLKVAVIDICWGMFITSATSTITYLGFKKLNNPK